MAGPHVRIAKDFLARSDLTATEKLVYSSIADRQGNGQSAWPGLGTIAKDVGIDRSSAIRAIKSLEAKQLISVTRSGTTTVNHYVVADETSGKTPLVAKRTQAQNTTSASGKMPPDWSQNAPSASGKMPPEPTPLNLPQEPTPLNLPSSSAAQTSPPEGDTSGNGRVPYAEILEAWNERCVPRGLSKPSLTPGRKAKLKTRWGEPVFREKYPAIFDQIASSPFCCGEGPMGWKADIDFAIRSVETYSRVLEGKYDHPLGPKRPTGAELMARLEERDKKENAR